MEDSFSQAAAAFVDLVGRVPVDRLDGPGLGDWDLRSLVGHASRSLITVDTYLDRPAESVAVSSARDYYVASTRIARADAAAVTGRGRQAGVALGEDPLATVTALVDRVLPRVKSAGDPVIETIGGGMRLSAYLPTRTFELVVHSLDIAAAAGITAPNLPDEVLAEVATLAVQIAVAQGTGPEVILALTGRRGLPDKFSVV